MARDVKTDAGLRLPAEAIEWRFRRGSGPGGQHRNTAETAVELVADLASLAGPGADIARRRLGGRARVSAEESRSQWRNRAVARQRLAELLDAAARPETPRRPTRPSRGATARRLEEKRRQSDKKKARRWRPGS